MVLVSLGTIHGSTPLPATHPPTLPVPTLENHTKSKVLNTATDYDSSGCLQHSKPHTPPNCPLPHVGLAKDSLQPDPTAKPDGP